MRTQLPFWRFPALPRIIDTEVSGCFACKLIRLVSHIGVSEIAFFISYKDGFLELLEEYGYCKWETTDSDTVHASRTKAISLLSLWYLPEPEPEPLPQLEYIYQLQQRFWFRLWPTNGIAMVINHVPLEHFLHRENRPINPHCVHVTSYKASKPLKPQKLPCSIQTAC